MNNEEIKIYESFHLIISLIEKVDDLTNKYNKISTQIYQVLSNKLI